MGKPIAGDAPEIMSRIFDALAELKLDEDAIAAVRMFIGSLRESGPDIAATREGRDARRLLRLSHERSAVLGSDLVSDPAWNMLLDLHAAHGNGQAVSVSSLCAASGSPVTTALRYLELMTGRGMVTRHADPRDARRVLIRPTQDTSAAMSALIRCHAAPAAG